MVALSVKELRTKMQVRVKERRKEKKVHMIVSTDSLLDCWKERNRKTLKVKMLNSFQNKFHGNHQSKKSQNRKNIKKK